MRKQLQKEFVEALRIAVDECGSQSELSRRSGASAPASIRGSRS